VFRTALGAVEAAMLDIKGKALGVPVFELLGGRYRDRVACYANHWYFGASTPEEYHAAAQRGVAMGYRALKWDPFEASDLEMDRAQRNRTIAIVEAVRDAVGPDVELMLDIHGRLNVPTAVAMCKSLARFDLTWIEEPTPPESIDALAEVRANSPVPIAAGERWYEPTRFLEALSMNAMTLHTAVAIPNFSVFETVSVDVPWRRELVNETLVFDNGHLLAPTAPGLGVELNEEACARFPYAPHDVPLFDGSINVSGVATGAAVMSKTQL
jgi:galactonate dehydratase